MKTITEYRPMIFSEMAAHGHRRLAQRRQLFLNVALVTGYAVVGLGILCSTGYMPWHWQFLAMFTPIFIAGEAVTHALRR